MNTTGTPQKERASSLWWGSIGALLLTPVLHPLLIPAVGVPSHLLWWVHVLPVALLTFRCGRGCAVGTMTISAAFVVLGEWRFGNGYGVPASSQTIVALASALTATNFLVAGFALYARRVLSRYRLLFRRVRLGVLQVASDGTVHGANPAATELMGMPEGDIIDLPFTAVVRNGGFGSLAELEELGSWSGQVEVGPEKGRRTIHAVLAAAREAESGTYQVMLADRSTEVMQEQELERRSRLSTLGEALAGVAHELNNPLAAILAHVQLAQMDDQERDDETREVLGVVAHEASRMRSIVRELVSFSRQEENAGCVDIDELLQRIVRVERITLGKRVRIDVDLAAHAMVESSAVKIEQIIINLLSNAAYAILSHGGTGVKLTSRSVDGVVQIEVRDDGPGIDPAIADRLFDPFVTTKPAGEGTGLGLAISRRLARAAGGELVVRNIEPTGAAFTLSLPAAGSGDVFGSGPDHSGGAFAERPAAVGVGA